MSDVPVDLEERDLERLEDVVAGGGTDSNNRSL